MCCTVAFYADLCAASEVRINPSWFHQHQIHCSVHAIKVISDSMQTGPGSMIGKTASGYHADARG